MSKRKTRVQWARDIRAVHKQTIRRTIQGVFKLGRMLIAAKASLDHGEFERMIERNLPFDASTAQRLMKIARDPRLQKAASMQVLPMAWSTLYELTKLDDEAFKQAVGSGAISELTTLDDARALPRYIPRYLREPEYAARLDSISSRYTASAPAPAPPCLILVADEDDDVSDQQHHHAAESDGPTDRADGPRPASGDRARHGQGGWSFRRDRPTHR